MSRSIKEICEVIDVAYTFIGDKAIQIKQPTSIYCIQNEGVSFWRKEIGNILDFFNSQNLTKSLIICRSIPFSVREKMNVILCRDPRYVFAKVAALFQEDKFRGAICYDAKNVKVGLNCLITNAVIADDVQIGPGCIIGQDGFGYVQKSKNDPFIKFPHFGRVVIGEGTIIHSNVCIDRGTLSDTIIGKNVRIDNFVHIAHNVQVGDNTLIIAGSIIGGGVKIGKGCWISPGVKIIDNISIADNTTIGIGSVVLHDIKTPGQTWAGVPAVKLEKK